MVNWIEIPRQREKLDRCSGRGSNPHGSLSQGILSPSRLPVSPPERRTTASGRSTLGPEERSGKRDSNPRPQPWQGCALPTELFPQARTKLPAKNRPNKRCISLSGRTKHQVDKTSNAMITSPRRRTSPHSFERPSCSFTPCGESMRRLLVRVSTVALAIIAVFANPVGAQRVLGVGDDALVLPRGVFRFRTLGQWTWFNERYGMDTPGRPNGALEPLGIDFTLDTIGVRQFPNLASLQAGIQQLSGNPNWFASLGNTVVNLRDHVAAFPFVFEAGLSKRFSVGIQIPYVHTQTSAFFNVNTNGTNGNLGFNPALAVAAAATQNATMNTQFTTAANSLEGSLAACQANPAASPSCPALLANQANARSLIAMSRAFAGGVNQVYTTSPFIPIVGTDAQLAIEARTQAFKDLYGSFFCPAGPRRCAANPITTNGPFASQNRLSVRDAQTTLTAAPFGIQAEPLQSVSRSYI